MEMVAAGGLPLILASMAALEARLLDMHLQVTSEMMAIVKTAPRVAAMVMRTVLLFELVLLLLLLLLKLEYTGAATEPLLLLLGMLLTLLLAETPEPL